MFEPSLYEEEPISFKKEYRWTSLRCAASVKNRSRRVEHRRIVSETAGGHTNRVPNGTRFLNKKLHGSTVIVRTEWQCFCQHFLRFCHID